MIIENVYHNMPDSLQDVGSGKMIVVNYVELPTLTGLDMGIDLRVHTSFLNVDFVGMNKKANKFYNKI